VASIGIISKFEIIIRIGDDQYEKESRIWNTSVQLKNAFGHWLITFTLVLAEHTKKREIF